MKISIRNNKCGCSETVKTIPHIYDDSFYFRTISIVKQNTFLYYKINNNCYLCDNTNVVCEYDKNIYETIYDFKTKIAVFISHTNKTATMYDTNGNILSCCEYNNCDLFKLLDKLIPKILRATKIKNILK